MTTPNLNLEELAEAQNQPDVPLNFDLRLLDALVQLTVLDIVSALPGSPSDGDRYIVGSEPTGTAAGHENDIAYYAAGWNFVTPLPGWEAWVVSQNDRYRYGVGSPILWAPVVGGGGGIAGVDVSNVGSPGGAVTDATSLQFTGAVVTDLGGGVAGVEIPTVGAGSLAVQNTGSPGAVVSAASTLQFEGAEVVDGGGGLARVIIPSPGGGSGGGNLTPVIRVSMAAGAVNDYAPGGGFAPGCVVIMTPNNTGDCALQGIDSTGFGDGDYFWLFLQYDAGASGYRVLLQDENTSSAAANRILCGYDNWSVYTNGSNAGGVMLMYDATAQRWRTASKG